MLILCFIIGLILLYLWMICPNLSRKSELEPYSHSIIAHRGLHNSQLDIPENSLLAYQKALDAHLAIEIDVHLTQDGQLVVFHDNDLLRVCGSPLVVEESTYQQLQQYGLNQTAERIPLLSQVLELVAGQVPLLIELKLPGRDMRLCPKIAAILDDYSGKYLIQSFNTLGVRWFKKYRPGVLRGQLASRLTKDNDGPHIVFRFCAEYLLSNCLCRPDFISYKFHDRKNCSLYLIQHLFHTPIAVWTLRKEADFYQARKHFHMVIFEGLNLYDDFINIL